MPLTKMSNTIYDAANGRFEAILLAGAFPEIQFKKENRCKSYNMMEHTIIWGKMAHLVHEKLVAAGYPDGIYTNKRSTGFCSQVKTICDSITAEAISEHQTRFKTWMG